MAHFLSPLDARAEGDDHWRLLAPLRYQSDVPGVGLVEVPVNFLTDLASVPRLPFVFWLVGDRAHQPAVVHDWLYVSGLTSRADADAVFYEAIRVVGETRWTARWTAWWMWLGVRCGGGGPYRHYRALTPRMR